LLSSLDKTIPTFSILLLPEHQIFNRGDVNFFGELVVVGSVFVACSKLQILMWLVILVRAVLFRIILLFIAIQLLIVMAIGLFRILFSFRIDFLLVSLSTKLLFIDLGLDLLSIFSILLFLAIRFCLRISLLAVLLDLVFSRLLSLAVLFLVILLGGCRLRNGRHQERLVHVWALYDVPSVSLHLELFF